MPEKMPFSAVICEFNPLHQGHFWLLDAARRQSAGVVCILSGNFVQRGEPAILDKWARTRLALQAGADLVAELPPSWACAGAERFARGGVALAASLPGVDSLVFGSEVPDAEALNEAAKALLSPDFSAALSRLPDDGSTFARRRQQALGTLIGPEKADLLRHPNAALAVEYCKAILELGAPLTPVAFPRTGAGHDQTASPGQALSASQLREKILVGENIAGLVPEFTRKTIQEEMSAGRCPASLARLERPILARLRAMSPEDFASLPDISEGLENRLYKASRQAGSLEELFALAKTKRYTHARVRRLVMAAFLGFTSGRPDTPPSLPVLGMTARGAALLKGCTLPVHTRPEESVARADDLYALATPVVQPCGRSFREGIIKI